MKKWFKSYRLYVAGAATGAVAGYLYWKYIGCSSGTCAITSSARNSTLYFAAVGALIFGLFKKENVKQ
jgi:hypothetical protein